MTQVLAWTLIGQLHANIQNRHTPDDRQDMDDVASPPRGYYAIGAAPILGSNRRGLSKLPMKINSSPGICLDAASAVESNQGQRFLPLRRFEAVHRPVSPR